MKATHRMIFLAAVVGLASLAAASETVTYTYDANGRVVRVLHTGSVNNNLQSNYVYDDADNRKNQNVTGSPN